MPNDKKLRVCFQQPTLAKYRVPFYRELANVHELDVKVIHGTSSSLPNCEAEGFSTEELSEKSFLGGRILWHPTQTSQARKDVCDVLVFSGNIRYAGLIPGLIKARKNGVGTVLWGHHSPKAGGWLAETIRSRILFPVAHSVVCYSHGVAEQIRATPSLVEKTFVAPNSVDLNPIAASREKWLNNAGALAEFRNTHSLNEGPVLLFVSRIKRRNQLEVLLDVLSGVQQRHPKAKAVIIGAFDEEQRRIAKLAEVRGLKESVVFPGAIYDETKLAPWFMSSAVFLYPAQIGLSLFHAFGYGLPVVAGEHSVRSNPELEALESGHNGYRFPDDDSAAATNHVLEIIENRDLRVRMGEKAFETVQNRFNIKIMANNFAQAIRYAAKSASRFKTQCC